MGSEVSSFYETRNRCSGMSCGWLVRARKRQGQRASQQGWRWGVGHGEPGVPLWRGRPQHHSRLLSRGGGVEPAAWVSQTEFSAAGAGEAIGARGDAAAGARQARLAISGGIGKATAAAGAGVAARIYRGAGGDLQRADESDFGYFSAVLGRHDNRGIGKLAVR